MPSLSVLLPLLLSAAGPPPDPLAEEVRQAILTAAEQTFEGRIQFHQEARYPPRPELEAEASHFDPSVAPQSGDAPTDARLRETYLRIRQRLLDRARTAQVSSFTLAVTLGPEMAVRLDRYSQDSAPITTVLSEGEAWEYRVGLQVLTTCDAAGLDDPQTIAAKALQLTIGEARYVAGLFMNQNMRPGFADAVQRATSVANGDVVADLSTEQGPLTIRFKRLAGQLRVSTITKPRYGTVRRTSFSRYVQVGGAWIAGRVEYTEWPEGSAGEEPAHRRTTREVTGITPLAQMSDPFARPDPYDAAYAELMYEHDVTVADAPMVPVREGLEEFPAAVEGLER